MALACKILSSSIRPNWFITPSAGITVMLGSVLSDARHHAQRTNKEIIERNDSWRYPVLRLGHIDFVILFTKRSITSFVSHPARLLAPQPASE